MLEFHTPTLEDLQWARPLLESSGGMGSECAFGTMFIWGDTYGRRICRHGDFLLSVYGSGDHSYAVPIGNSPEGFTQAVELLVQDAAERGFAFRMWGVTPEQKILLEAAYPGRFEYQDSRNDYDYIYRVEDLTNLSGRKYHGKRNHLSQFQRSYQWSYEDVDQSNLKDCTAVAAEWCKQNGCGKENGTDNESCAIHKSMTNFDALGFSGGLIRVDGNPVAFTMGEAINPQTYIVHFEKALSGFNGLYPAINHEFVARRLQGFTYVNREEDMGIEGLRKAKLSYNPAILLEKSVAVLKN